MARSRYLSYRMRRNQRRRRIFLGVAFAVIVVLLFLIWPSSKPEETIAELGQHTAPEGTQRTQIPLSGRSSDSQSQGLGKPEVVKSTGIFPEPTPAETVEINPEATARIEEATEHIKAGKVIAARDALNDVLMMPLSHEQRQGVKRILSNLADKWLFGRDVFPGDALCTQYKVQPGDLLSEVAKRFNVPHEILMRINNIPRAKDLRAGDTIKVINGPFHAKAYLSTFTMDVYLQRTYFRSFRIGHGRPDRETPSGLWRVKQGGKLIKPIWTDPDTGRTYHPEDPDYPLGSRWIALEGLQGKAKGRTGFAIHGTKKPAEINTRSSKGCIRLHNGDVIMLYNLVVPTLSEVRVED